MARLSVYPMNAMMQRIGFCSKEFKNAQRREQRWKDICRGAPPTLLMEALVFSADRAAAKKKMRKRRNEDGDKDKSAAANAIAADLVEIDGGAGGAAVVAAEGAEGTEGAEAAEGGLAAEGVEAAGAEAEELADPVVDAGHEDFE